MSQKKFAFKHLFQQGQTLKSSSPRLRRLKADISILLAVVILSGILAVGLAISSWVTAGFRLSRNINFSSTAYYAAESGMEQLLYDVIVNEATPPEGEYSSVTFDNGATFTVNVTSTSFFKARSKGTYQKANRQVEIQWPGREW